MPQSVSDLVQALAVALGIPTSSAYSVTVAGVNVHYQFGAAPLTPAASTPPLDAAGGKMFSTIEEQILKAATDNWQTAAQLAEKCNAPLSGWFRAILSNLVEREYLEGGRNGYRTAAATPPAN